MVYSKIAPAFGQRIELFLIGIFCTKFCGFDQRKFFSICLSHCLTAHTLLSNSFAQRLTAGRSKQRTCQFGFRIRHIAAVKLQRQTVIAELSNQLTPNFRLRSQTGSGGKHQCRRIGTQRHIDQCIIVFDAVKGIAIPVFGAGTQCFFTIKLIDPAGDQLQYLRIIFAAAQHQQFFRIAPTADRSRTNRCIFIGTGKLPKQCMIVFAIQQ